MVWRVANFLITSRQLVGRVGRVEFGERTTRQAYKTAADRRSTNHVSARKSRRDETVADVSIVWFHQLPIYVMLLPVFLVVLLVCCNQ